jgi:hypothetical protein
MFNPEALIGLATQPEQNVPKCSCGCSGGAGQGSGGGSTENETEQN